VCFLKFSRDKRGYEHFYLVEPVTGRRGKTRQYVLYWFRTPPNVKVGREPFDPVVMHALEAQYPGVRFDWEQLRNTPIPSAEPEYWRERRRADRAARRAQEDEDPQAVAVEQPTSEPTSEPSASDLMPQDLVEPPAADRGPEPDTPPELQSASESTNGGSPRVGREGSGSRRRRRRRHGQRRPAASGPPVPGEPNQTESSAGTSIDADEVTADGAVDGPEEE
jgi:hypothetical protein